MDMGGDIPLPERKDIEIPCSWIPNTPAKPIPPKRPITLGSGQGNPASSSNWIDSVGVARFQSSQDGACQKGSPDSRGFADPLLPDLNGCEAVLASENRVCDHNAQAIRDPIQGWTQIPCGNILTFTDAAASGNITTSLQPYMFAPFAFGEQSSPQDQLLLNGMVLLNGNLFNNDNGRPAQPQICQNGFPVPFPPKGNSYTTMLLPIAPVTPDKCNRIQDGQSLEVIHFVDDREAQGKGKEENGTLPPLKSTGKEPVQLCFDQGISKPAEFSPMGLYSHQQENQKQDKGGNQGIDLNRTPQQKPRRKKHRPKVIREVKPARKPKPVTPKPAKDKKNPSGNRRYIQKKGLNTLETPSDGGSTVNPDIRSGPKSVRRALSFDSEEGQARDGCCTFTLASNSNAEFQAQDVCITGNDTSSNANTTLQLTKGLDAVMENSPAGISFDLNYSINQILDDNTSSPENPNTTPHPSRREMLKENLKNLAQKRDAESRSNSEGTMPCGLQSGDQSVPKSQQTSNGATNLLLACESIKNKTSKRDCSLSVDDTQFHYKGMDPADVDHMRSYNEMVMVSGYHRDSGVPYFPEIYKKRRTEKGQNALTSNASSYLMHSRCRIEKPNHETHNNFKEVFSFADAQRFIALRKYRAMEGRQTFDQIKRTTKKRSKAPIHIRNLKTQTATVEGKILPSTPKNPLAYDEKQGGEFICRPQACIDALVADTRAKMKTKRRTKKGQAHAVNSESFKTNQVGLHGSEVTACSLQQKSVESTAFSAGNFQQKKLHFLEKSPTQDCQRRNIFQETPHASFVSRTMAPYEDLVNSIVQKLKCLNINGGHKNITIQAQNALVPYVRDGKIIPFEGLFDPTKKRRPRAKVDLDSETNRIWKLLMGKADSDGVEDTDVAKEKWWKEERRVFEGRVDSFIARMHLVQGDRRFSQWKGSVVDSVVGVFLTQNVSDHLSSSAYMALAARFPPQSIGNNKAPNSVRASTSTEQKEVFVLDFEDIIKWKQVCKRGSMVLHETEHMEEREIASSIESLGSSTGGAMGYYSKSKDLEVCGREVEVGRGSPENKTDAPMTVAESTGLPDSEDRRSLEDVLSSQNSVVSSQNSSDYPVQTADRIASSSESNSGADDLITGNQSNDLDASTSFMELLQMAGTNMFKELYTHENRKISLKENCRSANKKLASSDTEKRKSSLDQVGKLNNTNPSMCASNSPQYHPQHDLTDVPCAYSTAYHFHNIPNSRVVGMVNVEVLEERRLVFPSIATGTTITSDIKKLDNISGPSAENTTEVPGQKLSLTSQNAQACDSYASVSKLPAQPLPCSGAEAYHEKPSCSHNNVPMKRIQTSSDNKAFLNCSVLRDERKAEFQQKETEAGFQVVKAQCIIESLCGIQNSKMHQAISESTCYLKSALDVLQCSSLVEKEKGITDKAVESNTKDQVCSSVKETASNALKEKKRRVRTEKKKAFDWDSLRRQACRNGTKKERSCDTMDSLDWEAVRCADVSEIAQTIRERGMNNMLAERIKDFLNRMVREHGSIDLEWLRDIPPDKAKDYLLSIRGLGLKSVECVRLLTLHHLAFPVDTNVGRICVRLGWVPLQPLPESLQLHLLEMYPILETIQKYLWPRLCTLDQRTLYELHYQMITFGKVFCTKSKPNCNACPMRGECKHFASAFASARLALPGPEDKSLVSATIANVSEQNHKSSTNPMHVPQLEGNPLSRGPLINKCEPIIEEPPSPEPEYVESLESAIEDAFYEDPDEIPTIRLNFEEFTQNLQNYMQANNMELQDSDMSQALVVLTPEAASIPMPKLKNVSRLRTEHQVYELPGSHPLLEGLDRREPDDPCPYLLAIWTPGETAQSTETPEICCNSQDTGNLCDKETCFSCNSIRETQAQKVRGTLLIPCRTAMRGSFPLNGTYFQVNEVFADHESSLNPIDIPREWIWNLPRRTVYFGTSIPTIFRGLTTEGIQHCFWRGFVCVRGFDWKTRAPRPLMARLHFPASRLSRNKKTPVKEAQPMQKAAK